MSSIRTKRIFGFVFFAAGVEPWPATKNPVTERNDTSRKVLMRKWSSVIQLSGYWKTR
jgi:hypothetical protein